MNKQHCSVKLYQSICGLSGLPQHLCAVDNATAPSSRKWSKGAKEVASSHGQYSDSNVVEGNKNGEKREKREKEEKSKLRKQWKKVKKWRTSR